MKAAVDRVAPCVVRIETIGGLETVGKVLIGTGPTTGLIVSADGYIVSSAFNFVQKPASILVTLPGGVREGAKLVATDHNRMLVLLKVDAANPLPVPEAVPDDQLRVGQWSVAVGRTYEGEKPNVSLGIVSAVRRIFGKAVQTDAKISPANYGGPLVDIRGRVLGVLVPMSPQASPAGSPNAAVAGVEWYDSSIGFAVPLSHINSILPRWKAGKDLHSGILGVSFKQGDQNADPAVIAACRANSPAYKAGLKVGDTIVEINGQPVVRQVQVKERINPHYAGDTLKVVVLRDKERLTRDITLIDKLEPYQFPFLGILPVRSPSASTGGVKVRYVYPNSPAAKAGLKAGDQIAEMDGKPVPGRAELAERVAALEPGQKCSLKIARGAEALEIVITPGTLPESAPGELPPARESRPAFVGEQPQVGAFTLKIAEFENTSHVYVPEGYDPDVPHGVLIWFSADGAVQEDELLARWKALCDRDDLIILAPQSAEPKDAKTTRRWDPAKDEPFVAKLLDKLRQDYNLDRARIVAHGLQGGGAMAFVAGFTNRELVRAIAAVESPPAGKMPENEPIYRLAIWTTKSAKAANTKAVEAAIVKLREAKFPVLLQDRGEKTGALEDDELAALLGWIDTLDRI